MDMNLSLVVLISGLLVVFLVLILLTALIWCYGKIVSSVSGKGGKKQSGKEEQPKQAAPKAAPKASASVKKATSGIPGEIIAVIAAAIASLEGGGKYVIRGIKRSKPSRSAWGTAGVLENTRPF